MLGYRCRRRSEDGAAAVEFALVITPLLLVFFGLVQYGLYFWSMQGGADATRNAARLAAVGNPTDCDTFRSEVRDQVAGLGDGEHATVTRVYEKADPAATEIKPGDKVTVTVRFKSFDLNFPFLPFIDDGWVSQEAETRVEYVDGQPETCS